MVDLDPGGPNYPGERSLAALVSEGVRRPDLVPRPGVGVVRNGGVAPADAGEVIRALIAAHATVVLRLPPRPYPEGFPFPVVPVRLLVPGRLFAAGDRPAVYQATPILARMPTEGVRLPVPNPATVAALLRGRRPVGRDRWIGAWRHAWRFPWSR
ncbi:MAG: hypothetical protein HZA58_01540 [Acidimicrobiia bacterium]|nr:hypothetical protein [Acidimicrobiia bacterium]